MNIKSKTDVDFNVLNRNKLFLKVLWRISGMRNIQYPKREFNAFN